MENSYIFPLTTRKGHADHGICMAKTMWDGGYCTKRNYARWPLKSWLDPQQYLFKKLCQSNVILANSYGLLLDIVKVQKIPCFYTVHKRPEQIMLATARHCFDNQIHLESVFTLVLVPDQDNLYQN